MHGTDLQIALCADEPARKGMGTDLGLGLAIAGETGKAPESIPLFPRGPKVQGRDGREWLLPDPQALVQAFVRNQADLPVDFEHATHKKGEAGDPAPAVGWIKGLEVRDGAVFARVDWLDDGAAAVSGRKYRYSSPGFLFDKNTRQITRVVSAGLTNQPDFVLPAIARQDGDKETAHMEFMRKVLAALGLTEGTTEETALARIDSLKGELATARENGSRLPDPAKFVPRADHELALARAQKAEGKLSEIEKAARDKEIGDLVGSAIQAGKVAPASKDHYLALCRQEGGLDQFRKLVETLPVIGKPSNLDERPAPGSEGLALTSEEQKISKMFGNSAEDLKKYAGEKAA